MEKGLVSLFFLLPFITGVVIEAVFFAALHAPAALEPFAFGAHFFCDSPYALFFPELSPHFECAMALSIDANAVFVLLTHGFGRYSDYLYLE